MGGTRRGFGKELAEQRETEHSYPLGGGWATLFGPTVFVFWPEPGADHAAVRHVPN
jgi:hypothetical protein